MSVWIKQSEDTNLPKWLNNNLRSTCIHCGSEKEDFYNDMGKITARRCSNISCPGMMAEKIVAMCDILKVKGVGPATALKLISSNKLTSHFQAIPHLFQSKPKISLYEYMRLCFIKGIDTSWANVVGDCISVAEVFKTYKGKYRSFLEDNRELIESGVQYFDFPSGKEEKLPALVSGTVMMTGTFKPIRGKVFDKREDFIYSLNGGSKGLIQISIASAPKKTGVMALICEEDAKPSRKIACAKENGIPIMTPTQFLEYISKRLEEEIKRKRNGN